MNTRGNCSVTGGHQIKKSNIVMSEYIASGSLSEISPFVDSGDASLYLTK